MQDLNDLYFFVQVIDHGNFSAASRALMIPKSRLSRRIFELENRLGVKLIHRTTRQFAITDVGKIYYQHCKAMLIEAEAAQDAITALTSEPKGTIKISCPIAMLHVYINDLLTEFMLLYPKINLHIEATNKKIDLINEGIDIAVRVRPPPFADSDLVMRRLAEAPQYIVASPKLIEQHGFPTFPAELNDWPILMLNPHIAGHRWHLYSKDGTQAEINHKPVLTSTDMLALRTAAVQGIGAAQFPALMVQEYLKNGKLLKIVPDWQPKTELIHLVFPSRRGLLPSVRLLIDFLIEKFKCIDDQQLAQHS